MAVASVFSPIDSTEGIDFTDHVPLGQTTNGRIAGHLADGVEVLSEDGDLRTHPCRGKSSLNPGVAGADDDDVVGLGKSEHTGANYAARAPRGNRPSSRMPLHLQRGIVLG